MAILGEGNTSAKIDSETFWVKASGSCLETLANEDVVACRFAPLLAMLDREDLSGSTNRRRTVRLPCG